MTSIGSPYPGSSVGHGFGHFEMISPARCRVPESEGTNLHYQLWTLGQFWRSVLEMTPTRSSVPGGRRRRRTGGRRLDPQPPALRDRAIVGRLGRIQKWRFLAALGGSPTSTSPSSPCTVRSGCRLEHPG